MSDPGRSEAVLVGVHDYVNLEELPAVARNLAGLREALTDPAVWGLPAEACTVLSQPSSAGQVLDTVRDRARKAQDTLFIYYAGHGLTDPHTDELYLALPDSDREREYTSLRYEYLRRAVLDPQAGCPADRGDPRLLLQRTCAARADECQCAHRGPGRCRGDLPADGFRGDPARAVAARGDVHGVHR